MVRVCKKEREVKCPWCGATSTLVFLTAGEPDEYCMACKRSLADKGKMLEGRH